MTTTTTEPKRCPRLTSRQWERLSATTKECPLDAFLELWKMIEPSWDELTDIKPGNYELHYDDAMRFMALSNGACNLTWLNIGPGTYKD